MSTRRPLPSRPDAWIEALVDAGSFLPIQSPANSDDAYGPEVICGLARVAGRPAAVYAIDPGRDKGFVTSRGALKIRAIMDRAEELGIPIVAMLASAGVSIEEGLASGDAYTRVITGNVRLSGVVPQIAAVMGVTMGAPAYSATLMDLAILNRSRSHLMVTGPAVVERMLGESPTLGELGGAELHATRTGLADYVADTSHDQIDAVRALVAMLPSNRLEDPTRVTAREPAQNVPTIPARPDAPFDMRTLLDAVLDASSVIELGERFGPSMITAFARIDGRAVGVLANQSLELAGAIGTDAAHKSARFLQLCDAYNLPIVSFIDVPGFMPGVAEESRGLLRQGAAMCQGMYTSVPRVSVVVRKCYGAAAFVMMQTRSQDGDVVLALPESRIAVMGYDAAKHVVYPGSTEDDDILRARYFAEYESPAKAMQKGLVDEIVAVDQVRARLSAHLEWLARRRDRAMPAKRHGISA
jgi:acetyl-CoA carboxylase carboxyltransferase component